MTIESARLRQTASRSDTGLRASPAVTPPERERAWAQPHPEPILDAARVSLADFRRAKPAWRAYAAYAWLRLLRPVAVLAVWVGVLLYAWRHFFTSTDELRDVSLLALYAALVLVILLGMLLLAPVRRLLQAAEEGDPTVPGHDTTPAVADFARVSPRRLSSWRRSRSLQVRHDRKGRLRSVERLDGAQDRPSPGVHPRERGPKGAGDGALRPAAPAERQREAA